MFIQLVDSLRCVRAHELTWLVASARRMEDRDIVLGELGCHICGAEYPIVGGVADFTDGAPAIVPASSTSVPTDEAEATVRVAALLDLAEPGGFVTLAGVWAAAASRLTELVPRVHLLLLNAPPGVESGGGISLVRSQAEIPVRPDVCRGIALDEAHATPSIIATAVDALRPAGRLLAPVSLPIPDRITELARDAHHWVGAKESVVRTMVQLGKRERREERGERR